jgi:hypothetical protein
MNLVFSETSPHEHGFAEYFDRVLKSEYEYIEKNRLKALAELKHRLFIMGVIALGIVGAVLFFTRDAGFTVMAVVLSAIVILITGGIFQAQFQNKAKFKLNDKIVRFFGDFNYIPDGGIGERHFEDADFILPDYETMRCEDYIHGNYKNSKVEFCETTLRQEYRDSDGDTSTRTVFHGIFFLISLNEDFRGETFIVQDCGSFLNFFKRKFTQYQHMQINDPDFERIFEVYTSNESESRALLSEPTRQVLMNLARCYGRNGLACSFFNNKIFITIPVSKNLFETASMFKHSYSEVALKEFLRDFNSLLKIADEFTV